MCGSYDMDLNEFAVRIDQVNAAPTDADLRHSLCEQSRFVLDAVEQAVMFYDRYVTPERKERALSLFAAALEALSGDKDVYYEHVTRRYEKVKGYLLTLVA